MLPQTRLKVWKEQPSDFFDEVGLAQQVHAVGGCDDVPAIGRGRDPARGAGDHQRDAGCDVVVNARRVDDLEQTAEGIRARGRRTLVVSHDIRDYSEQLAEQTMAEFGRIDVWVNNVGGSDEKDVHLLADTADETFRTQVELNLVSAFQGSKAAANRMAGPR